MYYLEKERALPRARQQWEKMARQQQRRWVERQFHNFWGSHADDFVFLLFFLVLCEVYILFVVVVLSLPISRKSLRQKPLPV